jgi:hypothetical protein
MTEAAVSVLIEIPFGKAERRPADRPAIRILGLSIAGRSPVPGHRA